MTGTVEDLDRELPQTLLHFVSNHLALENTLERAKAEMEEASKVARAEAKKKSGSQITKKEPTGNSNKPAVAPEAPVPAKAESSKAACLFDSTPEPARVREADAERASTGELEIDEDEEILREAHAGRRGRRSLRRRCLKGFSSPPTCRFSK